MRCKSCKIKIEKGKETVDWISVFCCKSHKNEYNRAKVRVVKEKVKVKKEKIKKKRAESVSTLTKTADKLWSELIKIQGGNKCAYCGTTEYLNSHHLFTRSRRATRWDLENWITLCSGHHTLSSEFSAHQTSLEFFLWIEELKWREFIEKISKRSQQITKVTSEYLQTTIELFKTIKIWFNNK
jgi:5-methylcytosine-specific restriction endonuclease McrA